MVPAEVAPICIVLGLVLVGCAAVGPTVDSSSGTSSTSSPTVAESPTTTIGQGESDQTQVTGEESMDPIIVDLAVEWRPEAELDADEVAEQRETIRIAQQKVLKLLEGTDFQVNRAYQSTPQIALSIDAEGRDRLNRSSLVENVNEDIPDPPSG